MYIFDLSLTERARYWVCDMDNPSDIIVLDIRGMNLFEAFYKVYGIDYLSNKIEKKLKVEKVGYIRYKGKRVFKCPKDADSSELDMVFLYPFEDMWIYKMILNDFHAILFLDSQLEAICGYSPTEKGFFDNKLVAQMLVRTSGKVDLT